MLCGGSRLEMIEENIEVFIWISLKRDSFLSGELSRDTPDQSRVEFKDNLRANHLALSADLKLIA